MKSVILTVLLAMFAGVAALRADTGHEGAVRTERGSYAGTRLVAMSSTTGTALFPASVKRPDGMCINISASIMHISTISTTVNQRYHDSLILGFPVASSGTFQLDGSFTGALYGTCDVNVASCYAKCIDGLVP